MNIIKACSHSLNSFWTSAGSRHLELFRLKTGQLKYSQRKILILTIKLPEHWEMEERESPETVFQPAEFN